jgi:hypothetical protein
MRCHLRHLSETFMNLDWAKKYYHHYWRYRRERALLEGRLLVSNDRPSCLFFTTQKCASTYMTRCLKYLNKQHLGLYSVDLESYIWGYTPHSVTPYLQSRASDFFFHTGFFYAPLHRFIPLPDMRDYRVLLMLRDPRDVLVSHYYSLAYSHAAPTDETRLHAFLEHRKKTQEMSIDDHVISWSDHFFRLYDDYCRELVAPGIASYLSYEKFITDFPVWMRELGAALDIELSARDQEELWRLKGGDVPVKENKYTHVRKGTPGDYREKLKTSTQEYLTVKFRPILETLGYV